MEIFHKLSNNAIIKKEYSITYRSLIDRVEDFKIYLQRNNFYKIALYHPKCLDLYAILWGAYYAGATICCINNSLTEDAAMNNLASFKPDVVFTNKIFDEWNCCDPITISNNQINTVDIIARKPNSVLFVIFTSGSTGTPKGACILRKAFESVIEWSIKNIPIGEKDTVGQFCECSFDMGLCDIFLAFSIGAAIVPIEGIQKLKLGQVISEFNITYIYAVPTIVDILIKNKDYENGHLNSLKTIGFGGAPLRPSHIEYLSQCNPKLVVFNTYGPTETTLFTSFVQFSANKYKSIALDSICLGKEIDGVKYELLKTGENSELIVKGDHCFAGYITDTMDYQNASSVNNYYTGDLVRTVNGEIYFFGRKDNQIKLRGNRLDLDGIDSKLFNDGIVASAIVVDDKLIVFHSDDRKQRHDILKSLKNYLPQNCLPDEVVFIEKLPMNNNGKYDKNKLATIYYENKEKSNEN